MFKEKDMVACNASAIGGGSQDSESALTRFAVQPRGDLATVCSLLLRTAVEQCLGTLSLLDLLEARHDSRRFRPTNLWIIVLK